jgi:ADP-heptose:LPS heptosyltransferase
MVRLILKNSLSPGDLVLLTAAVRDLHRNYPNQFLTDVRTPFPGLWKHNPHITPLSDGAPGAQVIECQYPLIHASSVVPLHAIHGFVDDLNRKLSLQVQVTEFKGDLYLSDQERQWVSPVEELVGKPSPFWVLDAGGKYDVTIKWWSAVRFQKVVDHFKGRILFVQVGANGHHHPRLDGVLDLRGRTTLRELIRLVHHSDGCLCGVTALMHLAAAVPMRTHSNRMRPCVVVAGAREPAHWEQYPGHQYIENVGALPCSNGGCWKDRVVPLGDGDERDDPERLCVDPVGDLPRCMDLISAEEVIRRIELYYSGGALRLNPYATSRNDKHL